MAAAHGVGPNLFVQEADWYNEILLGAVVPGDWWRGMPHPMRSWLRNTVGGFLLYFLTGFLWCFVIYYWKRHAYIPKGLPSPPSHTPQCCFFPYPLRRESCGICVLPCSNSG
jgi:hypothetical protein